MCACVFDYECMTAMSCADDESVTEISLAEVLKASFAERRSKRLKQMKQSGNAIQYQLQLPNPDRTLWKREDSGLWCGARDFIIGGIHMYDLGDIPNPESRTYKNILKPESHTLSPGHGIWITTDIEFNNGGIVFRSSLVDTDCGWTSLFNKVLEFEEHDKMLLRILNSIQNMLTGTNRWSEEFICMMIDRLAENSTKYPMEELTCL